ncbi:hypothetical protein SDC9_193225 [bioreactor metagenome]|uniref:Uncharacterized protein n=1 Tax=bioreactor metagenome TaxID=1076179 RepID=A0A645I462_9ZZZZ
MFTHILNFKTGQHAKCERFFQRLARVIGVHMHLDDFIILYHNHTIADRLKKSTQRQRILIGRFAQHDEFGTVGKCNFALKAVFIFKKRRAFRCQYCGAARIAIQWNNDTAFNYRLHAFQHNKKALAARVDNAGLFKYGQHIRRFIKHLRCRFGNFFPKACDILAKAGSGFAGRFGRSTRHG